MKTEKDFIKALILYCAISLSASALASLDDYNVTWDSPGKTSADSMPLGNGDIGLNLWTEPNGDICFYISKTDAWGDNSRLLKVGKVRVKIDPSPLDTGFRFHQMLNLENGDIQIQFSKGQRYVILNILIDANNPMIYIYSKSVFPITLTLTNEPWRTEQLQLPSIEVSDIHLDRTKPNSQYAPTIVEPDTILKNLPDRIGWFHHNTKSVGPELTMKIQDMQDYKMTDPILYRTFGAVVTAVDAKRINDLTLTTKPSTSQTASICVLTQHPSTPQKWHTSVNTLIEHIEKTHINKRIIAHRKWWSDFWDRSWIYASQNKPEKISITKPNKHNIQIGIDQTNSNRFKGEIAKVNIFNRPLNKETIQNFAKTKNEIPLRGKDKPIYSTQDAQTGPIPDSSEWNLQTGFTLEAWIKPESLPGGGARIIDKITSGGDDGFLLDTYPGNSLRFITSAGTITKQNVLSPGKWSHVAATAGPDGLSLYLNAEKIATQPIEAGDPAFVITRGYTLQRFINACAGRGAYPIKFNGTIFTVDHNGDPDYRRWGPGYWWQNTRLPYISMPTSGDFDLMQPLFDMYAGHVFEISKYRTRRYFDHPGVYYPECIYFWGPVFSESYGWTPAKERKDKLQISGWHKWEWVCGPELVWMMLDYYEHTLDKKFLTEKIIPVANEVFAFFDNFYKTNPQGKLVMHPSQAVETWWNCTNPMPELAGLIATTDRLLNLPENTTSKTNRTYWKSIKAKLPPLPTRKVNGTEMLAPAEIFKDKRNIENPELYAVFPFRLVSLEKPNAQLGIEALNHRWDKGTSGWRQDDIFMAYLGLTDQAKNQLTARARSSHSGSRFPAFWGPNYDWVPDQDHGGILLKALQSMLMQTEGKKILLLPAWPKEWDVDFKLNAPYNTTLSGTVNDGRLTSLNVSPENRRKDIVVMEPQ